MALQESPVAKKARRFTVQTAQERFTWKASRRNLKCPGLDADQVRVLANSQGQELYKKMLADRVAAASGAPGTPTFGKHY